MKRVFIDMDNVLVDFQSGLDQVSEEVKAEYAGRLDEIPGLFAKTNPITSWQDKNFCFSEEGLRAALKAEGADMNSFRMSVNHQPIKGSHQLCG